jgi:LmeA-like phospholipid-binding
MLLSKIDNIGEKTINKIAEMAFKSQIKNAEHLSVQVKTDPNKLSKGILESLSIDGYKLEMQKDLRLEKMQITLNNIAVSPLKALMGNVQLTQPSQGEAYVVLSENDIETALNFDNLNQQLRKYDIRFHNQRVKVRFFRIDCRILGDGRVIIKGKLQVINTQIIESICLVIKPSICKSGQGIFLGEVKCIQGEQFSAIIINSILEESTKILNLDNFLMDGISLDVKNLSMEDGKLNLLAIAKITHLPSRR